jgi:hypothetical protein
MMKVPPGFAAQKTRVAVMARMPGTGAVTGVLTIFVGVHGTAPAAHQWRLS